MRLGILGGSFDPIHNAHLIVARLAMEQLGLDRVHFVVAAEQPFKQGLHGAAASDRLRMVRLAIAGIDGFVADDRELRRPPPSYTVDTLRELHAEEPQAELVLIVGADVARSLAQWREPDAVQSLATVAVVERSRPADAREPRIPAAMPAAGCSVAMAPIDISSTDIRQRAAAGQSLAGWVPSAVADYIVASRLYGSHAG